MTQLGLRRWPLFRLDKHRKSGLKMPDFRYLVDVRLHSLLALPAAVRDGAEFICVCSV
jgi:hypothetical protein